ncbi:MAG TPA: glycosyltransferase family 4 protein [Ignavibacteria bacterium]|nr:glycosyltransferase family 4 protein [Ignavibacteria bacterium]
MITIAEISECFPNKNKPVTGEFILQHTRALSEYCNVIMIVPLRMIPPKEVLTFNPAKLFPNLKKWISDVNTSENFREENLRVIYFPYASLPRPYFEALDAKLMNAIYFKKLKNLLKEFQPELIYCNWLRPWSEISNRLARFFNVPFIMDHHEDLPTLKELFPDKYIEFLKPVENADKIIVHSTVNKSDLEKEDLKLNEIKIIYLGQNFSIQEKIKNFNFPKLKFVCVSHLYEKRKNIDILIKAFSILKNKIDFRLTIAGDGVYKQGYIDLTESLSLRDRIKFAGSLSRKEVESLLEESDIFILPSFPEAFGIVFIEALSKGLPVITCKGNGGGEELLNSGYEVVLTKPFSAEDLAGSVIKLTQDKERMNRMSESGKEILRKNFSWKKNAESTFGFIQETISEFKLKANVRN